MIAEKINIRFFTIVMCFAAAAIYVNRTKNCQSSISLSLCLAIVIFFSVSPSIPFQPAKPKRQSHPRQRENNKKSKKIALGL